jgi:hypothetical protein
MLRLIQAVVVIAGVVQWLSMLSASPHSLRDILLVSTLQVLLADPTISTQEVELITSVYIGSHNGRTTPMEISLLRGEVYCMKHSMDPHTPSIPAKRYSIMMCHVPCVVHATELPS